MIIYVKKEAIYPAFGICSSNGTIKIREDLPRPAKKFVLEHETYHITDKSTYWLWRELKANSYSAIQHPVGFIITAVMSLAPYRLKYYYQRFKNNH